MMPKDLLVLHDEVTGVFLQNLGVVDVSKAEHLHHILHPQTLDSTDLHLSLQWAQIIWEPEKAEMFVSRTN